VFLGFGLTALTVAGFTYPEFENDPTALGPMFLMPFFIPFSIFACIFPLALAVYVFRIIAAVKTFQGQDFRYPVIGKWAENWARGS
jgi:uncharacterized membrane protein